MKHLLLAGVAALALAPRAAFAADMPRPVTKAPAAVAAPLFNWTGCYVGAHAGGLWGEVDHSNSLSSPDLARDDDFSSFTAGGHLGCNYQINHLVLGIEGDLSWADVHYRRLTAVTPGGNEFLRGGFDWYGTVRGRLGLAADRWHIFATAGAAFSDIRLVFERVGASPVHFSETSKSGWVAGAGLEYACRPTGSGGSSIFITASARKRFSMSRAARFAPARISTSCASA